MKNFFCGVGDDVFVDGHGFGRIKKFLRAVLEIQRRSGDFMCVGKNLHGHQR